MSTVGFLPSPAFRAVQNISKPRVKITREYLRARAEIRQNNNEITDLSAAMAADPTTHAAFADAAYYACNTVDPDFDIDSSTEFDDDLSEDNIEAHYAECGLRIMGLGEFILTYIMCVSE